MDEQTNRTSPKSLIRSLDDSLRDLETGAVSDAGGVQAEARRLLQEYETARPPSAQPSAKTKHAGVA